MPPRIARRAVLLGGAALPLAACSSDDADPSEPSPAQSAAPSSSTPTASTTTSPTTSPTPSATATPSAAPTPMVSGTVAEDIAVPWGIAFLPDGTALVGARDTGEVWLVDDGRKRLVGTLEVRSRLDEGGETGLLGLALHPDFLDNALLYAYLSTDADNRVVRMTYDGALGEPDPVLTGIGTSVHHNGGGLVFGPDRLLYAATGDAEDAGAAQDQGSLDGKVLRMTDTGEPADGNPFGSHVFSLGHRNVEGLTFDDEGRLWAAEFGDKGADELNLVELGGNYGWPDVEGSDGARGYADPLAQWPVEECSPSGVAVAAGRAWLGALRGECVWSVVLDGPEAGRTERHLAGEHGRIRRVDLAPDGSLWVTTSNRDGRTDPRPGDDRILRVTL